MDTTSDLTKEQISREMPGAPSAARVLEEPADVTTPLRVELLGQRGQQRDCTGWVPRGDTFPQQGDTAWVQETNRQGELIVIAWWPDTT